MTYVPNDESEQSKRIKQQNQDAHAGNGPKDIGQPARDSSDEIIDWGKHRQFMRGL